MWMDEIGGNDEAYSVSCAESDKSCEGVQRRELLPGRIGPRKNKKSEHHAKPESQPNNDNDRRTRRKPSHDDSANEGKTRRCETEPHQRVGFCIGWRPWRLFDGTVERLSTDNHAHGNARGRCYRFSQRIYIGCAQIEESASPKLAFCTVCCAYDDAPSIRPFLQISMAHENFHRLWRDGRFLGGLTKESRAAVGNEANAIMHELESSERASRRE